MAGEGLREYFGEWIEEWQELQWQKLQQKITELKSVAEEWQRIKSRRNHLQELSQAGIRNMLIEPGAPAIFLNESPCLEQVIEEMKRYRARAPLRVASQLCVAGVLALVAGSFWAGNYLLIPVLALAGMHRELRLLWLSRKREELEELLNSGLRW